MYWISCTREESANPPVYVIINSIRLETTLSLQGSAASNITDAWVYLDDSYFGTFTLPAKFPVLLSGDHSIKIAPGIKINGASGARTPYPFYTSWSNYTAFSKAISFDGAVHYTNNANIIWLEDFENGLKSTGMNVEQNPSIIFEGKACGAVYLDNINTFAEFKSNSNFVLPKSGTPIYLELNFKSNLPFSVSIQCRNAMTSKTVEVGGGNTSLIWKKIYFNLTPAVVSNPEATDYGISITVQNSSAIKDAHLFLDNVKLVCFK